MSTKKVNAKKVVTPEPVFPNPVIVHKHAAIPPVVVPLADVNHVTLAVAVITLAHAIRTVADDVRLKDVVADMDRLLALL
jgi:hypothetical protein